MRWKNVSWFTDINPDELALLATVLGIIIADDRDIEEQNTIGNFIIAVGATILAISSQKQFLLLAEIKAKEEKDQKEIDEMKKQIKELQSLLNVAKPNTK